MIWTKQLLGMIMSNPVQLEQLTKDLCKPYIITRSKLGSTTKVIERDFVCNLNDLERLFSMVGEKVKSYQPTKAGFQYLISFSDCTHLENNSIHSLYQAVEGSDKCTDKVIFNWIIAHEIDNLENEMSITVRISNPMNPFVMLQAALSKNHSEADGLDFEDGSISVSIHGATQTSSEEVFAIVGRWAKGCTQPKSVTGSNIFISKHIKKLRFINRWILPVLFASICIIYLASQSGDILHALTLAGFVSFLLLRDATALFNHQIEKWAHFSTRFSLFSLTGGDHNQQSAYIAISSKSNTKLILATIGSFTLNLAAGAVIWYLTKPS